MLQDPWYDPKKSYDENLKSGPAGGFASGKSSIADQENPFDFFGKPLRFPFGIPAGPLLNSEYVVAALDNGFDVPVYKTVRTRAHACHPYPNVLPVDVQSDLTLEKAKKGLFIKDEYESPLSITNSFGVPSRDPSYWQEDLATAVRHTQHGQHVVGSFQGTKWPDTDYISDWILGAKLVTETGVSALEANLSCPNEGTSNLLCFDTDKVAEIADKVKSAVGDVPFVVKIAYFEDEPLREFVKKVGSIVDGISAINTIPSEIRDQDGNQALPGEGRLVSGVCGASIKWAGISMVSRLKTLRDEFGLSFKIDGVGGVTTKQDYTDYRNAGADIVMSATGAMWNSNLAREIKDLH